MKKQNPKRERKAKRNVGMKKWEYQITRHHLQNAANEGEETPGGAFYCDDRGQCFLHDTSQAAAEMIREAFNEEGKGGWELIQFGYHLGEMLCVWKRAVD
jgi:hypothetical protein